MLSLPRDGQAQDDEDDEPGSDDPEDEEEEEEEEEEKRLGINQYLQFNLLLCAMMLPVPPMFFSD